MANPDVSELRIGQEYTRPELARMWGYRSHDAFRRGLFTPRGLHRVFLFITREKAKGQTQYLDSFTGKTLTIEGDGQPWNERRLRDSLGSDDVYLFYREHYARAFTYHGPVYLQAAQRGPHPDRGIYIFSTAPSIGTPLVVPSTQPSGAGAEGERSWIEDVALALHQLDGIATLSEIYKVVRQIRSDVPQNYQAVVRRTLEENSSDSRAFRGGEDLFFSEQIGTGVWGLRSATFVTPMAVDVPQELPIGSEEPVRVRSTSYRVVRDTVLSGRIKTLHRHHCQICYELITLPTGQGYSEAHHIRPLGAPHNGPDIASNILVLCPNHHAMLDYGVIQLDPQALHVAGGHEVGGEYVRYHNKSIYRSPVLADPR